MIERQKADLREKELLQKTEALDYLNEQLEKAELQNNETKEKLRTLELRLQQMLLGIADIFMLFFHIHLLCWIYY